MSGTLKSLTENRQLSTDVPLKCGGKFHRGFLLQTEVFQPEIHSKGPPGSTSPPFHREFSPQSSLEVSSRGFHTEWTSWTGSEKTNRFGFKSTNKHEYCIHIKHAGTLKKACEQTSQSLLSWAPRWRPITSFQVWCLCGSPS